VARSQVPQRPVASAGLIVTGMLTSYRVGIYTRAVSHILRLTAWAEPRTTFLRQNWILDPGDPGYTSWIEEGWHHGHRCCGRTLWGLHWFWAESWQNVTMAGCDDGGSVYAEHYDDFPNHPVNLTETHPAKISYYQDFKWRLFVDGDQIATTKPCHSDYTMRMQTGNETTYETAPIGGDFRGLQKRRLDATWSNDWTGSYLVMSGPSNPVRIFWTLGQRDKDAYTYAN